MVGLSGRGEALQVRVQHFNSGPGSSSRRPFSPATTCRDARFGDPASVKIKLPLGTERRQAPRLRHFCSSCPPTQPSRAIRCSTNHRSPFTCRIAIRRRTRRSLCTVLPWVLSSGGSTVRSRNGLTMRTDSSFWPRMRFRAPQCRPRHQGSGKRRFYFFSRQPTPEPAPSELARIASEAGHAQRRHRPVRWSSRKTVPRPDRRPTSCSPD